MAKKIYTLIVFFSFFIKIAMAVEESEVPNVKSSSSVNGVENTSISDMKINQQSIDIIKLTEEIKENLWWGKTLWSSAQVKSDIISKMTIFSERYSELQKQYSELQKQCSYFESQLNYAKKQEEYLKNQKQQDLLKKDEQIELLRQKYKDFKVQHKIELSEKDRQITEQKDRLEKILHRSRECMRSNLKNRYNFWKDSDLSELQIRKCISSSDDEENSF